MAEALPIRETFRLTFEFTDFTSGNLDREALAEALFDHLVEGDYRLDPDEITEGWSIDSWDANRDQKDVSGHKVFVSSDGDDIVLEAVTDTRPLVRMTFQLNAADAREIAASLVAATEHDDGG